jgi:Winged helix DNA-binding domain
LAASKTLSDGDVRRMRTAAQLLNRPRRRSPADLVRYLTGVQAQYLPAARLALRSRTEGMTADRVERARLRDRSIVVTWAMRGTLHLVAAEDVAWLVPLVMRKQVVNSRRRIRQEGLPDDLVPKALRLLRKTLATDGPLTKREFEEALQRKGIPAEGQAAYHLMFLASAQGTVCRGPERGRDPTFVLASDWLGGSEAGPNDPLAELAVRYLRAHGPAEPADLAYWAGINVGEAKAGWGAISDKLAQVETERGPKWILRSRTAKLDRGPVRLLPWFDEYLMGWRRRDLIVTTEGWRQIIHGDGGLIYPVVVADGRVVAVWEMSSKEKLDVTVRPFDRLEAATLREIRKESEDVARFYGRSAGSVKQAEGFVPRRPSG